MNQTTLYEAIRDEFSTLKVAEESELELLTAWATGGAA